GLAHLAPDQPTHHSFPTRRSSDLGSLSTLQSALVTSHPVTLSGLSGGTVYHFRVRSRDAAGNLGLSSDGTFTTLTPPDVTAPTVSMTAPAAGATISGGVTVTAGAT